MTLPWLSDAELAELCHPLEQPAARVRWLRRQGLHVETKPSGAPIVMRSELERVMGADRLGGAPGQNAARQPDRSALLKVIKGGKRGAQAQGR